MRFEQDLYSSLCAIFVQEQPNGLDLFTLTSERQPIEAAFSFHGVRLTNTVSTNGALIHAL